MNATMHAPKGLERGRNFVGRAGPVVRKPGPYDIFESTKATQLTSQLIEELLRGEILVLEISNFVSRETCDCLATWSRKQQTTDYTNDVANEKGRIEKQPYGVWRIGPVLNTIFNEEDPKRKEQKFVHYLREAPKEMQRIASAVEGLEHPIEKLIKQLRNGYKYGAEIPKIEGNTFMSGIIRGTEPGITPMVTQPHVDTLRDQTYLKISNQFSAMIMLEVPEQGGEFCIQNGPTRKHLQESEKDFIQRICSRFCAVEIKPEQGKLILFNTGHPHFTKKFNREDGRRVAMQTFFGTQPGMHEPILVWN